MAKRRKAGGVMDRLPNRKYVRVAFEAATTTAVYTEFDTMMGAREGAGWLISRVDLTYFNSSTLAPLSLPTGIVTIGMQVLTGAQTALLPPDDDEVVCDLKDCYLLATSGGATHVLPASWAGPVLVASRTLSVVIDGSANVSPFQSGSNAVALVTIWYNWVKLGAREWVEIAEARGIA